MAKVYSRSGLPKNRFHFVALALVTISGLLQATQVAAADPLGNWRLSSGKITVRVSYCGGTNICASIVGMAQPLTKQGTPKIDKDNPNPALRNRRIIGLQVVNGMTPEGENRWKGKIYNADDGYTYSATAEVSGDQLVIKACTLGGLACKKKRFARVN